MTDVENLKPTAGGAVEHDRRVLVAIQVSGICWGAFEVRMKRKGDVYVNHLTIVGHEHEAHISYHASGQRHTKVDNKYVEWTGGVSGGWEKMIFKRPKPDTVADREQVARFLAFDMARMDALLKPLDEPADMTVDASGSEPASILAFAVSIVGPFAEPRADSYGFPIIQRQRFTHGAITIEIEAFRVTEELAARPY